MAAISYLYDDDDGTTTTSARVTASLLTPTLELPFYGAYYPVRSFEDDYFSFYWKKMVLHNYTISLNRTFAEHLYRLKIALIFNVHMALFYRKLMFSKSGFLARVGRKKRN